MLDPVLVDVAQMSPGVCFLCRTHNGPFVDTRVTAIEGRVYVCVKTCAAQIAELAGWNAPLTAEGAAELRVAFADLRDGISELEDELARSGKVVALNDVLELVGSRTA